MEQLAQVNNAQFWSIVCLWLSYGLNSFVTVLLPNRMLRSPAINPDSNGAAVYARGLSARNFALAVTAAAALIVDNKFLSGLLAMIMSVVILLDLAAGYKRTSRGRFAFNAAHGILFVSLGIWLILQ